MPKEQKRIDKTKKLL